MPAGSSVPSERNDGREEDDGSSKGEDWEALSTENVDSEDETPPVGDEPAETTEEEETHTPPAPKPGEKPKPGEQTPKPGEGEQPPQETEEQRATREAQEAQARKTPAEETPEKKAERERQEQEQRQRYEAQLVEYYKLQDDDAARLQTEPETVLPKLAAKMHQAMELSFRQYMAQQVPQYLHQFNQVQQAEQRTKAAFMEKWPGLSKYEQQVLETGKMYRQMNPKAKPADAIERIGAMVCAAMGLDPAKMRAQGDDTATVVHKPAARGTRKPPARPAAIGSSGAGAAPPPDNEWSQMAEDLLDEDRAPS